MTLQFKTRHCNGIILRGLKRDIVMVSYCVDLTSVYSFTIDKFVLTSVSASIYYFSYFV